LLVVGYGFQDHGINEILEDFYLKSGKNMVVINPEKPSTNLIDDYNAKHIDKKLEEVTYEELLGLLDR
jgi:homospermidine synthase